jgi:hypothetical protein
MPCGLFVASLKIFYKLFFSINSPYYLSSLNYGLKWMPCHIPLVQLIKVYVLIIMKRCEEVALFHIFPCVSYILCASQGTRTAEQVRGGVRESCKGAFS